MASTRTSPGSLVERAGASWWSGAARLAGVLSVGRPRRAIALGTRVVLLLGGSLLIAVAVATMLWNRLGPGPLDVLIVALRGLTGMPLTLAVWGTIGALTLFAWALGRRPGLGTVIAPVVIGPVMQVTLASVESVARPDQLVVRLAIHVAAIAVAGVGAGAMIVAGLGAGTGELLAAAASERSGRPEAGVRLGFEFAFVTLGVLLGGPIGVGTVLVALGIGPAVAVGQRLVCSLLRSSRRHLAHAHVLVAAH